MRILVEASTESEWVAQYLDAPGHEVIVADPNYAPMYGQRSRRIKTDRRDVVALAEACQRGTYRPAHRRSARQHEVQCRLNVHRELTQARTRAISVARGITRAAGLRIRSGRTETFLERPMSLNLPPSMHLTLSPLQSVIEILDDELSTADKQFEALVGSDPVVKRLTTLPGIGPITASAFVAALDVVSRFERAGQVTSYLGLVPQEYSSGEKQRRGRIIRSAHPTFNLCLCKRPGACGASRIRAPSASGHRRRPSLGDEERKSRWSRSPGVWRARSSQSGAIRPSISPNGFDRSDRSLPLTHGPPPRSKKRGRQAGGASASVALGRC